MGEATGEATGFQDWPSLGHQGGVSEWQQLQARKLQNPAVLTRVLAVFYYEYMSVYYEYILILL